MKMPTAGDVRVYVNPQSIRGLGVEVATVDAVHDRADGRTGAAVKANSRILPHAPTGR